MFQASYCHKNILSFFCSRFPSVPFLFSLIWPFILLFFYTASSPSSLHLVIFLSHPYIALKSISVFCCLCATCILPFPAPPSQMELFLLHFLLFSLIFLLPSTDPFSHQFLYRISFRCIPSFPSMQLCSLTPRSIQL